MNERYEVQYPKFTGPEHGPTFDFPLDSDRMIFLTSCSQMSCGNFWSLRQIDTLDKTM